MTGFPHTQSRPPDRRGRFLAGNDITTALAIYGTGIELPLLASVVTLGRTGDEKDPSIAADLRIDDKTIAGVNARFERLGGWMRVENVAANPKNPIIFCHREQAEFYVQPGDSFRIGETTLLAMNDEMRLARPTMSEIFGRAHQSVIDDCLIAASDADQNIMLVGDEGSELETLALAIHTASPRRRYRCVPVPPTYAPGSADLNTLVDAQDGTLVITLPPKTTFDRVYVAAAVAPTSRARLIICSHAPGKLRKSFPAAIADKTAVFTVPALITRRAEIPQLLDRRFIAQRSGLRFAQLKPTVQRPLLAHRWPENLRELHKAAFHLMTLAHYESERAAERDKTVTRSESRTWRKKLKLPLPLVEPASTTTAYKKSKR